jgi:N-acetylneuraminic acid mutarotase
MSKAVFKIFALLVFASLLLKCDNYEFPKSPYPGIETLPVVQIVETGVTFQANITQPGDKPIINHGFVWGFSKNVSIDGGEKIQLGSISNSNSFEANVTYGLYDDTTYYVKAFVETELYLVYGKVVAFTSKGSTLPVITSFSPSEGTWGDTITIKGNYFSTIAQNSKVKFGPFNSIVLSSTDSTIQCIVPDDIPDKSVPIHITVSGNQTQSAVNFTLITPAIDNFSPQIGTFGDIVTITGTNFSLIKEMNVVKFNGYSAEVVESTNSLLKVKVPSAIREKDNSISVTVKLQTATANNTFSILPPSINSLSTTKEFIGAIIQISGNNFNPAINGNIVLLGETTAKILSATKNLLSVQIPEEIYKNRTFALGITVAEQSVYSSELFTLQDAWIRKADVPHGQYGRYGATAFSISGMGYVGLGSGGVGNKFWRYHPQENSWTEVASFPGGERAEAVSFVIGEFAYVGLGGSNDFWRFDPASDNWTRISDFPYAQFGVGLSANGKGYIITQEETQNFWEYDPTTDQWSQKIDFPGVFLPYVYPDDGFVIGENLFLYTSDNSSGPNQFYEYDFSTDSWILRAEVEDVGFSFGVTGFSINGNGYIRGTSYMYKYNLLSDSWITDLEGPPGERALSIDFTINGKVYFGTSFSGAYDLWEFDPDFE